MLRKSLFPHLGLGLLIFAFMCQFAQAQRNEQNDRTETGRHARILVNQDVDESKHVELPGNTRPEADREHDRGPVPNDLFLDHMLLQLKRSPEQEQALQQYLEELQTKGSPNYQHWLTAQEFGERFGVSARDIEHLTHWLGKHGLQVNVVYPSGMVIDFSGTASQVDEAFHTNIHKLQVKGKQHFGNISNPQVPAAFASVIAGVVSLHNFSPHAMHQMRKAGSFTFGDPLGGTNYAVAPPDLATIYNFNPLFKAGYSGQGQTIAVIEDTDVFSAADWKTFRSTFGLSKYTSGSFATRYPAPVNGSNNCLKPGVVAPNDAEAILDAEWASAAAPGASILMATCADTTVTFGGLIALQNLINASSRPPAIMSISYGQCETENGAAANAAYYSAYQQAVAEGVSVFVAAGDSGAAGCDNSVAEATHGIGVNAFASTPFNVAVGGTDFSDTYTGTNSSYWNSTNTSAFGSARSYIPEIPWNDSCASALFASYEGFNITHGPNSLCNDPTLGPFVLSTVAGGGGPSACATGTPSATGVVGGTCQGWPKPAWQSVFGNPNDGVRDTPDVSLFAADGLWGHYYVFCWSDVANGGAACSGDPSGWSGAGGTSFSSPIMAGIQALVNQKAGARQGNPNPAYYQLASKEFSTSNGTACNSSNGAGAPSSCVFYDVTQGDMDVNCSGNANCFLDSSASGVLSTSNSSFQSAYGATPGWDFATGIGSLNATNLVNSWPGTKPSFTLSTSTSSVSVKQGHTATATVSVTQWNGFTGNVTFSASGLPSGVTASFSPTSSQTTSTLTLTAGASAPLASATITVTGTAGTLTSTATINLSVVSAGTFTLSASSPSLSVAQGGTGTSTINVAPQNGFTDTVTLSASGLPSGVTASFNPSSTADSSVLTVTASSTAAAASATMTVTGVSGTLTSVTTLTLTVTPPPSYTLSASPGSLNVIQGASGTTVVTVAPQNGFNGSVNFSASGLPSGVTASFNPNSTSGSTTVTLSASSTAATGPANVVITGVSGTLSSSATIALTVALPPTYTVSASPNSLNIIQGASGTTVITVAPQNGFTGSVTFSTSGLPSGVSASFSPSSTSGSTTLTLSATSTAATGTANVTVTGTSGTLSSSATITLIIVLPPTYTVSASPNSLNIIQGASGTTVVTVAPQNGFNGSVSFSASGLPSGVTASFNPTSTSGSTTLTLSASSTAATGPANVIITGVSGTLSSTVTISLTVSAPPTFTLSANPSSVSIVQGNSATSVISITPQNGFTGTVTFAASGLLTGVTASFNPASATGSSTLTLTAAPTASTGTVTIMISGTSGNLSSSTPITLTVVPAPSFALSASPNILGVVQGGNVGSTVNVTPQNGFAGSVVLSALGLPAGVTAAFTPASTNTTSSLVLTASSIATTGSYTLVINGTSGSLTSTTAVTLTVTAAPPPGLPSGWSDLDIGPVGAAGSGSFANGTFTVNGAGQYIWSTTDGFNFAYQQASGDITITARMVSIQGGAASESTGIMIRDGLAANGSNVYAAFSSNSLIYFDDRATTGASTTSQNLPNAVALPYWVRLVRSGSTFSGYSSPDGVSWTQIGGSQTITMAPNVYVGLAVSSNTTNLATATFDNVSISVSAPPNFTLSANPSSLSLTQGGSGTSTIAIGPQNGFSGNVSLSASGLPNGVTASFNPASGATSSVLTLTAGSSASTGTVNVTITGTSGSLTNSTNLSVTVNQLVPGGLPSGWTDIDLGSVGTAGNATYNNGVFTVKASGQYIWNTADGFNFVYQPVSGDATIIARMVSVQGGAASESTGIMFRDGLSATATNVYAAFGSNSLLYFDDRPVASGNTLSQSAPNAVTLPYWVKIVRSGNTFTGYSSLDGLNWTPIGTSVSFNMAQNVYVGLAVSSNTATLATATFDNVSVTTP